MRSSVAARVEATLAPAMTQAIAPAIAPPVAPGTAPSGRWRRPQRRQVASARVAVVAVVLVMLSGCAANGADAQRPRAGFALAVDTSRLPPYSAERAHDLLVRQVAFGPRVPGSAGHAAQLAWMTEYLAERADTVVLQPFGHELDDGRTLRLTNVLARYRPDLPRRILLVAHWDTRPTADQDTERRDEPIDGANDGASGTAVLLELANVLSSHSPPLGVDLLFVDGEDYGPGESEMYLGAKHFAANQPPGYQPRYGIVVDMVGDRSPQFPLEGNSLQYAPAIVDRVWGVAEQVGLAHLFVRRDGGHVTDDHVPLNRAGIPTILIIDFEYGPNNAWWHTHQDIVANTAPAGLGAVGRVLTALIFSGG
jgi:glutaminyl-peptide cyclotransferase